jgi:hypothetical protein
MQLVAVIRSLALTFFLLLFFFHKQSETLLRREKWNKTDPARAGEAGEKTKERKRTYVKDLRLGPTLALT